MVWLYKIGDVAELLKVEKTDIFAKLISHKSLLEPNIKKVEGVTYFEERGLEVLKTLFYKKDKESIKESVDARKSLDDSFSTEHKKTLSKYEREKNILYDQIEILNNELTKLDMEIELKDQMLLSFHEKLLEDLEILSKFQNHLLKNVDKNME